MEEERALEREGELPLSSPKQGSDLMPSSVPPLIDADPEPEPEPARPAGAAAPPVGGDWYDVGVSEPQRPGVQRRRTVAMFLVAVVVAAGVGVAVGATIGSNTPPASTTGPGATPSPFKSPGSVNAIAAALTRSVVDIDTSIDEPGGIGEEAGSGMILTSSGEVLTNNHVIEDATKISVTIPGRSRPVPATVVGVDTVHDVALIQLDGVSGLAHVDLGNSSDLHVGDGVVAIGNALGLGGTPAATGGAVSALHQSIRALSEFGTTAENLTGLIETDAQIQPGDSGGPLVDVSGKVVGMDTAEASSSGGPVTGFAIPIDQAIAIVRNIERGVAGNGVVIGLSAFMGVLVKNVPDYKQQPTYLGEPCVTTQSTVGPSHLPTAGLVVVRVVCEGPAAVAGIVPGDTIVAVDGKAVTNNDGSLPNILSRLRPGDVARVKIVSVSGVISTLTEKLGAIPS